MLKKKKKLLAITYSAFTLGPFTLVIVLGIGIANSW